MASLNLSWYCKLFNVVLLLTVTSYTGTHTPVRDIGERYPAIRPLATALGQYSATRLSTTSSSAISTTRDYRDILRLLRLPLDRYLRSLTFHCSTLSSPTASAIRAGVPHLLRTRCSSFLVRLLARRGASRVMLRSTFLIFVLFDFYFTDAV